MVNTASDWRTYLDVVGDGVTTLACESKKVKPASLSEEKMPECLLAEFVPRGAPSQ